MTPVEISAVITEQEIRKDIDNGYLLTQGGYDRLYFETDAIKELREMQVKKKKSRYVFPFFLLFLLSFLFLFLID